jgi:hypothetical protein
MRTLVILSGLSLSVFIVTLHEFSHPFIAAGPPSGCKAVPRDEAAGSDDPPTVMRIDKDAKKLLNKYSRVTNLGT